MVIEQIYDKPLAQASYAVESDGHIMLVDPGRNPEPYLDFANKHTGKIVAIFETHPHADFTSSHLEFQNRHGAKIYTNPKVGVTYEYEPMDHEDTVKIGNFIVKALFTPGHSPDHNSYLLIDKNGYKKAVFSGDSLLIGDVGRPDLRESAGHLQVNRKELANMMYNTIHNVFANLPDDTTVFPAHGAGSLCGRNLSDELTSTIGLQKEENWAFHVDDKGKFVENFLEGQAFVPKYFPYNVEINRNGAPPMAESVNAVPHLTDADPIDTTIRLIDSRKADKFKEGHLKGSINIQSGKNDKFETWLGSIIEPKEPFYLIAEDQDKLDKAIGRTAKIGYEKYIKGALINPSDTDNLVKSDQIQISNFKKNPDHYTIVDIRNKSEVQAEKFFDSAINIPLPELVDRIAEVPVNQPVAVHCAGGYRSAIGTSILQKAIGDQVTVYDLSDGIEAFRN